MTTKRWQCMSCVKWIHAHEGQAVVKCIAGSRVTFILCHECHAMKIGMIDSGAGLLNAIMGTPDA